MKPGKPLERRTPLKADLATIQAFVQRGRQSSASTRKRTPISPASAEQRKKVDDRICVNCTGSPCDPAHLVPRSLGGCDSADCVIPLCRDCHRLFDEGQLDLEGVLALPDFAAERSHMALHWPFARCMRRLRGRLTELHT